MTFRVRVYDSTLIGMFLPGGDVYGEAQDIADEIIVRAIVRSSAFSPREQARKVPERHIVTSHFKRFQPAGPLHARSQVVNLSEHALYKHNGTRPIITSPRLGYMQIPVGPWGPRKVYSVSGQIGEPWLVDAANDVLFRYGVRATTERLELI